MASSIAQIVAGTLAGGSYCASFRAAKIAAAISSTRLRPSSTEAVYHVRFLFVHLGIDFIGVAHAHLVRLVGDSTATSKVRKVTLIYFTA